MVRPIQPKTVAKIRLKPSRPERSPAPDQAGAGGPAAAELAPALRHQPGELPGGCVVEHGDGAQAVDRILQVQQPGLRAQIDQRGTDGGEAENGNL